jgi:hypothetical protein
MGFINRVQGIVAETAPASGATPVLVAAEDASGNVRNVEVDASGRLSTAVNNTVTVTGPLTDAQLRASAVPVSAAALPLPSGAATETTLSAINTKTPSLGQAAAASSSPVTLSNENVQDLYVIGQSAQTATVNNILTTTAGAAATDTTGYRSFAIQVVSTGTGGTFIFEGSNDNVNFQAIPVFNQALVAGAPIVAAITATASQIIYIGAAVFRYVRLRIATTITGGSVQAFSTFSQAEAGFTSQIVAQSTAANLQTTATIASGTVTTVSTVTAVSSVTSSQSAIPGIITDVASAALTTTTTTGTLTPTFGAMYSVVIPVTVVTGTAPTLDVQIQESDDTGTNWVGVYDFPRITATGFYRSPVLPFTGNRIRYVQTVGGTTPSFTRAINRLQSSLTTYKPYRQLIDRTVSLTTLSSATPALTSAGASNAQLVIAIGAVTVAPALQLQGSDDAGASWYSLGAPLTAVASSTVQVTVPSVSSQLLRAIVTTAGTGVTSNYVLVKAF